MADPTEEFDDLAATRKLLGFMTSGDYRPMLQREIMHNAHIPGPERPAYRKLLRRLQRQGRIRKLRGGRLVAAGPADETRPKRSIRSVAGTYHETSWRVFSKKYQRHQP